jgi:alkylation response protein AidB-like acyl-CoA dehydrogenase
MTATSARPVAQFRGPYDLTEEQQLFKETVHEFGQREIVPIASELDEREEFPRASIAKMAELGLLGLLVPEEFGGTAAGTLEYALAIEEISWADASHSVVISVNDSLVCEPLVRFGTDAQQRRFLPSLASGEYIGAYCLSEATSGSDASNMNTLARRDGDGYVLNGTKSWITNGGEAGLYLVYAVTNPDVARARGITAFLVPGDTPGLRAGAKEKKLGIRASSTTQIFFEDCRVPADAVLGTIDEGFKIAMATLDGGRSGSGAQALGIAQRAFDETVRYAKEREAFGHPIADFQGLQWRMADMATRIESARLLVYRAARMKDAGQSFSKEGSMAKLFASETAMFCAHAAVQTFGGYGFVRDYPVEKLFRDAKITEIYEGTSEIQRLVISRHVLR